MRNVFDQYHQPENRLTHALVCTLSKDRRLLRPFLRWLQVDNIPHASKLRLVEQQVPGFPISGDESESKGLPDACIYDESEWAVLIEAKVQAAISRDQLRRHVATAKRHGYSNPQLIVLAVDESTKKFPKDVRVVAWKSVYEWFSRRSAESPWAKTFVEYMQQFEAKMVAQDYSIRGTITMFDGLRFNEENPYTYAEAKRLLRLLGDELQKRPDLKMLGVDPKGSRRPAITGRDADGIWDYLPLKISRQSTHFTEFPHLTLGIRKRHVNAETTIPNGIRGGLRTKISHLGIEGFHDLLTTMQASLQKALRPSPGAKPFIYLLQRHFPNRLPPAELDGELRFDLRTLDRSGDSGVRYQPQWVDALFELIVNKKSNIQWGVEARFRYDCPIVRSRKVTDLFAKSWLATKPLLDVVLND